MEEVGKIFPRVLRRHVRGPSAPVLEVLTPLWSRVAGKAMAAQARPVAFAAGTLTLATCSASWARELYGLREEIRAAVNRALGSQVVRQVRVRLAAEAGAERATAEAGLEAPPSGGATATAAWSGAEAGALEACLDGLELPARRALAQSFAKYFARRPERVNRWH